MLISSYQYKLTFFLMSIRSGKKQSTVPVYDTGVRRMVDVLIAHEWALEFLLGPIQALDTHSEHELLHLLHYLGSRAPAGGG
jgi:hypothetical protein